MRKTYDLMDLALCIIEPAIAALFADPVNTTGRKAAYKPATFSKPTAPAPTPAPQPPAAAPAPADPFADVVIPPPTWPEGYETPSQRDDREARERADQDAAGCRGPIEERAEREAAEDDDRGFFDLLTGAEVCDLMRRHKVRVADLQRLLLVSQHRVQHVRKYGVCGAGAQVWRDAICGRDAGRSLT